MKESSYYGNYLGIVIQNNDPLKRGRVKVFVPHVSPSIYSGWNEIKRDKRFKFVGKNLNSDLTDILDDLKKIMPWAECASPLVGENTSGRFNASIAAGSISDTSKKSKFLSNTANTNINQSTLTKYSQNYDDIGEKSGNVFDINYFKLKDAFNNPDETNVNNVNKFSYNYTPDIYSNSAKGSFSIPCVGAHLWVFFVAGDPLRPVYFASSFGESDWSSIYSAGSAVNADGSATRSDLGVDYPGDFENKRSTEPTPPLDAETYRNKYIINQKGGTLAFINTDNKEAVKLSHYSGSFKELNNFTNIELATKSDQKLVLEDLFLTVQGDRNEYTGRDYDLNTVGNFYKKIGKIDSTLASQWKGIVRELADIKQLFETKRADRFKNNLLKFSSTKQNKVGTPVACPVCRGSADTYFIYNISYNDSFNNIIKTSFSDAGGDYAYGQTNLFDKSLKYVGVAGTPVNTQPVTQLGGAVDGSNFNSTPGSFMGRTPCPACGGRGTSPSSQDGNWSKETKEELINQFFNSNIAQLSEIEKQLGLGGNEIIEISKHKFETIGTIMNDFGSIRIDDKGKMEPSEVVIAEYGTFLNRKPTPVHEYVHVTDLPGGNYTLNVSNRYNLLVGAGGVNIKSFGPVNVSGTITNIAGEQVNVGSENEINIDGGKRVSITGDVVSIRQRDKRQVLIDSSLGVSKNSIVLGGGYFEGELHVQHVTAPMEIQNTNKTLCYGAATTDPTNSNGKVIGYGIPLSNFPIKNPLGSGWMPNPVPGVIGPPYIGYTDALMPCGRLPLGLPIGFIPGNIPIGYIAPGACVVVGPMGTSTNPGPIPVLASQLGAPAPGPGAGDVKVFASSTGNTLGFDTTVFGSGFGSFLATGPVGGTGIPGVGCVKGSDAGLVPGLGGVAAVAMPLAIYGSGRDDDSIMIPEHSHMFANLPLTLKQTNKQVREQAISTLQSYRDSNGDNNGVGGEPAFASPVVNSSKQSI
jgi:hypothetical protein